MRSLASPHAPSPLAAPAPADLEAGDDPALLVSEDAVDIALMDQRRAQPPEAPEGVALSDATEVYRHSQAAAGPTILLASLEQRTAAGGEWDTEAMTALATRWREVRGGMGGGVRRGAAPTELSPPGRKRGGGAQVETSGCRQAQASYPIPSTPPRPLQLLFTAGIEVTCFDAADMGELAPPGGERQMIVTLQHGWRGYEAREFLLQQPEVALVEWDAVKTAPPRLAAAAQAAAQAGGRARRGGGGKKARGRRSEL